MDVIDTRFERFRVRAGSCRWLWRLLAALVLGGLCLCSWCHGPRRSVDIPPMEGNIF